MMAEPKSFREAFQPLGPDLWDSGLAARRAASAAQHVIRFGPPGDFDRIADGEPWRRHVGLAVKLDVLVMFTVVAFVSAIVLGAF